MNEKAMSEKAVAVVDESKSVFESFDTRGVVFKLRDLMTEVTANDVTPETVNAACNCADKITDVMRLHLDAERLRRRAKGM